MKTFNAAIIGCGAIHSLHADAIKSSPNINLTAVVDIDGQIAKKCSDKYGCTPYTDYKEMLKDPQIDTVHICTPHYLHAPMAIDVMKCGKHVLCEKPIAIKIADAAEMIAVSKQTGKSLGICFQNRYNTTSKKMFEVLSSGKTGRILGAKAFVTWRRTEEYYKSGDWRGTLEKEGGGVLINQSIHTLDLLQWLLGDIDKIKGHAGITLLEGIIEVEDTADATIVFKGGHTSLFYATNCYASDSPVEIEIICEHAVIRLSNELIIKYSDGTVEQLSEMDTRTGEKAYWGCSHAMLIEDFYRSLSEGKSFAIDGSQGVISLKMIECIYKSSKSRVFEGFDSLNY